MRTRTPQMAVKRKLSDLYLQVARREGCVPDGRTPYSTRSVRLPKLLIYLGFLVGLWGVSLYKVPAFLLSTTREYTNSLVNERWTVVVTSNSAFEQELLNWWYHFRNSGILRHGNVEVVLYAEDEAIYEKYKLSTKVKVKRAWETSTRFQNVHGNDKYVIGESGFNELVSRRPSILLEELTVGGPFVLYMDLDVILLRDPLPFFVGKYDLWGAGANNKAQRLAAEWVINSGFLAIRPNAATIECLRRWNVKLQEPKEAGTNQGPFNEVVSQLEREERMTVKLLLDRLFPVGRKYRDDYRQQMANNATDVVFRPLNPHVVAFHNNFCSSYKECKIHRAMALGVWANNTSSLDLL